MGHAGYSPDGTLSELVIYPEEHLGTFIVVDQGSNNNIQADFRQAFIDRFLKKDKNSTAYGSSRIENKEDGNLEVSTKQVEGIYRFSDYPKSNFYKANTFGGGEVKVKVLDETRILVAGKDDFTFEPYEKEAERVGGLSYQLWHL